MKISTNTLTHIITIQPDHELTVHNTVATLQSTTVNSVIGLYGKDVHKISDASMQQYRLQSLTYMFGLQGSENAIKDRSEDVKTFLLLMSPRFGNALFQQYTQFLRECVLTKSQKKNTLTRSMRHKNKIIRFCWIDLLLVSLSIDDISLPVRTMQALQDTFQKFF
jgi:hypothetical protein